MRLLGLRRLRLCALHPSAALDTIINHLSGRPMFGRLSARARSRAAPFSSPQAPHNERLTRLAAQDPAGLWQAGPGWQMQHKQALAAVGRRGNDEQ